MQQLLAITVGINCLTNTSISRVMLTENSHWLKHTFLFGFQHDNVELKQFNYLECRMCKHSITQPFGCSNIFCLLRQLQREQNNLMQLIRLWPLKVGVTQNSHVSGTNDEMFTKCEHIAIWLNDQKYHIFQLCNLCIRINEMLQNPKLSPANEEPLQRWKAQHLHDVRDDQYGYEFRILQAKNSKNITSTTGDGSDNGNMDSLNLKYMQCLCIIGTYTNVFNAPLPGGTKFGD